MYFYTVVTRECCQRPKLEWTERYED